MAPIVRSGAVVQRLVGATGAEDHCSSSERPSGHSGALAFRFDLTARVIPAMNWPLWVQYKLSRHCNGQAPRQREDTRWSCVDLAAPSARVHEIICAHLRVVTSSGGRLSADMSSERRPNLPEWTPMSAGCRQLTSLPTPDPSTEWPPRREMPRLHASSAESTLNEEARTGGRRGAQGRRGWAGSSTMAGLARERDTKH